MSNVKRGTAILKAPKLRKSKELFKRIDVGYWKQNPARIEKEIMQIFLIKDSGAPERLYRV
jgi:hypothetical protein